MRRERVWADMPSRLRAIRSGPNVVIYVVVDDPDALYREWRAAGIEGHLGEPENTGYRAREGTYADPDGERDQVRSAGLIAHERVTLPTLATRRGRRRAEGVRRGTPPTRA